MSTLSRMKRLHFDMMQKVMDDTTTIDSPQIQEGDSCLILCCIICALDDEEKEQQDVIIIQVGGGMSFGFGITTVIIPVSNPGGGVGRCLETSVVVSPPSCCAEASC